MHAQTEPPQDAAALFDRGTALLESGQRVAAAECLVACVRAAPGFGAAYVNLAAALRELALLAPAQEMAEQGLALLPHSVEARLGLANVLHDRCDFPSAVALYRAVLAQDPHHAGACSSLANTLQVTGQLAEALALHDRAVALAPGDELLRINRAACRHASGDLLGGWADNEWRRKPAAGPGDPWRGEALDGRTILIQAEQGFGDVLQFVRYAPLVAARGGRVLLHAQPALVRLLRAVPGVAEVIDMNRPPPHADLHCPLLSLPRIFGTRLDSIPAEIPYLSADPALRQIWRARLPPAEGRFRVGLVWAGGPHPEDAGAYLVNRRRSLAPSDFTGLADVAGVQWVSLQMPGQPAATTPPPGLALVDPMPEVVDFTDTAAIVANLDLVISVDTAVAHLAGGMGRPVWLLSRHDGCWRWLRDRTDSPWYPTVRIFRQEQPQAWAGVLAHVAAELQLLSQTRARGVAGLLRPALASVPQTACGRRHDWSRR